VKPNEFVIYRVFGRIPMVLDRDYGVMPINDGDERKPRARFILAIRKERKLIDTHNFATFRKALRRIPRGTAVYPYDTCIVLRSYGLSASDFRRFDRAMRRFKHLKPEEGRGICICICICICEG